MFFGECMYDGIGSRHLSVSDVNSSERKGNCLYCGVGRREGVVHLSSGSAHNIKGSRGTLE